MAGISLLVADDSITIQKVIGIIFGSDEYSLTVVDNGKAAVQKARENQPDVLLIDALMPGMSGYEVCEEIRRDPALAAKPVLLLTGSFEPFDENKARQCGADDHIVKPFESQQIVAKVRELFELGLRRKSGAVMPAAPVTPAAPEESTIVEQPLEATMAFESTSFAPAEPEPSEAPAPAFSFHPEPEPSEPPASVFSFQPETVFEPTPSFTAVPAAEPAPVRSPDDPWGAFTTEPVTPAQPVVADEPPATSFVVPGEIDLHQQAAVAQPAENEHIGASWVPVEEQTFEFREEAADDGFVPSVVEGTLSAEEIAEPEPAFAAPAFEPAAPIEPVIEEVAELPSPLAAPVAAAVEAPVAVPAAAVALTEDQLKAAILSASRETIERIIWEVVPDLAEAMIREAIKKITEQK